MSTSINNSKISETSNIASSKQASVDYKESSIVLKAIRMAETMKKYSRSVRNN